MSVKFPTLIAVLSVLVSLHAQAQIPIGLYSPSKKTFKLQKSINEITPTGDAKMSDADKSRQAVIPASHKMRLIQINNNVVKLKDLSDGTTRYAEADAVTDAKPNTNVSAIGGAFTFPFKYRPQTGVLEPSLSLSGVAGIKIGLDKNGDGSLSFLVGFGPSSISVNNTNSADTNTANATRSAATFSLSALAQWNNIQLAISAGIDNNLNNSADKWIYQSKPWFAIGIGFNVFSSSNSNNISTN